MAPFHPGTMPVTSLSASGGRCGHCAASSPSRKAMLPWVWGGPQVAFRVSFTSERHLPDLVGVGGPVQSSASNLEPAVGRLRLRGCAAIGLTPLRTLAQVLSPAAPNKPASHNTLSWGLPPGCPTVSCIREGPAGNPISAVILPLTVKDILRPPEHR